jgi:hypothetical protein
MSRRMRRLRMMSQTQEPVAAKQYHYWRFIKWQYCVELPMVWRACYEVAPGIYANSLHCWN